MTTLFRVTKQLCLTSIRKQISQQHCKAMPMLRIKQLATSGTASMSSRSKVLVYNGLGGEPWFTDELLKALKTHVDTEQHEVETITPKDVKQGNWIKDCHLIALGGGYDRGFIKALGEKGAQVIREFVLSGGAYLGIGAGGYYACREIEFDKGGPLEVVGKRPLKFYPGKCIGPAFPGFEYHSQKGTVAAETRCNLPGTSDDPGYQKTLQLYTDGDGYFISTSTPPGSVAPEVLATFWTLPGEPAAIVKCRVGEDGGRALLSEVHFECCPDDLDPDDPTLPKTVLPALYKFDKDRQVLMTLLLKELGLQTKPLI